MCQKCKEDPGLLKILLLWVVAVLKFRMALFFSWNGTFSQLKHLMCFLCFIVNKWRVYEIFQILIFSFYWHFTHHSNFWGIGGCTLMSYFSQHVMIWNKGLLLNGRSLVYLQVLFKVEFRKHCTGQHWHYFVVMFLFSWCWALLTLGSVFFSCWRFLYFHQLMANFVF